MSFLDDPSTSSQLLELTTAMEPRRVELMLVSSPEDPLENRSINLCGIASISSNDIDDDCSECCASTIMSDFSDDDHQKGIEALDHFITMTDPDETAPLYTMSEPAMANLNVQQLTLCQPISVISPGSTPLPSLAGIEDGDNSSSSSSFAGSSNIFFSGEDDEDEMMSLISSSTASLISFEHSLRFIPLSPFPNDIPAALAPSSSRATMPTNRDMITTLPEELVWAISSFLDVPALGYVRLLSKKLRHLASHDEAGWARHCHRVWSHKSVVCAEARRLSTARDSMRAYHLSIRDARQRQEIQRDELVFDPLTGNGIVWDFRFKETAGSGWTSLDPWFRGREARKLVFLRDGSVKQLSSSTSDHGYGQEQQVSLRSPFCDDVLPHDYRPDSIIPRPPANYNNNNNNNGGIPPSSLPSSRGVEMTWRFISRPMDFPERKVGAYIRLTVDGREVPTYVVHRSPCGDWGFVIESCWGVFSSSPLARQGGEEAPCVTAPPSSRTTTRRPRRRIHRTRGDGNGRWLNAHEEDGHEARSTLPRMLSHDGTNSSFSISTSRQWREALLYNYGAVNLPEGEDATAEFDRVWNLSIRSRRY